MNRRRILIVNGPSPVSLRCCCWPPAARRRHQPENRLLPLMARPVSKSPVRPVRRQHRPSGRPRNSGRTEVRSCWISTSACSSRLKPLRRPASPSNQSGRPARPGAHQRHGRGAGLNKYLEDHPVTDAELKPEYDAQVAAMPREYHARHILVEDKATADALTDAAQGRRRLRQAGQGKVEGLFQGQRRRSRLVHAGHDGQAFCRSRIAALKPGQLTELPVQSQFGWHVIKLEDIRSPAPPAFDDVKEQVRGIVQRKRLQAYLEELRKGAKIEKKI